MQYVVVTLNVKSASVVCVDGIFQDIESAQKHADELNKSFTERQLEKYKAKPEVITKP